ncbi:MAG: 2Fe-2S iron-sulfur cluster binding domain-containing protein [Rickettsiales bacterium]|nr:2Fe-2S iron-sulfur cluster binding domain-containing protein [Rickettsiales bacterium]
MVKVIFVLENGSEKEIEADEGTSILEIAHINDIDLQGACNGALACATCHVILDEKSFAKLPKATPEEEELLDFAFGVAPTSRLSCQVRVTKELDGIRVKIPTGENV